MMSGMDEITMGDVYRLAGHRDSPLDRLGPCECRVCRRQREFGQGIVDEEIARELVDNPSRWLYQYLCVSCSRRKAWPKRHFAWSAIGRRHSASEAAR